MIRPNTSEQKRILILLSIVIGLLLIGIGCFGILLHQKSAQEPQHSTTVSAVSTDSTTTELEMKTQTTTVSTSMTSTTTATTVSITMETTTITVCAELATILDNNGYTLSDLGDSKQLIAVVSSGCSAVVYGFSAGEQGWQMDFVSNGCVGTNGVSANSREGIYCTPKGLFSLGFAFGTDPLTDLSIPYRQLNENCYWVDDPASPVYNQWQETTEINWNSAEHLIDYASSYHYAVVVNYNRSDCSRSRFSHFPALYRRGIQYRWMYCRSRFADVGHSALVTGRRFTVDFDILIHTHNKKIPYPLGNIRRIRGFFCTKFC